MGMRSMGSCSLSFGLVTVPVKVYLAASSQQASFNTLHEACGARVKQKLLCPACDTSVDSKDTIKGYEYARGQYVHFTSDEVKALGSDAKGVAHIAEFVPSDAIGIVQTEKCYYLAPDKGGADAYVLLRAALERTGSIAVAQWVNRGKEHLVAVRPHGPGLLMQQVFYAAEVRDQGELPLPDHTPNEAHLEMAERLIEQYHSEAFDSSAYIDRYSERVAEAVEAKVAGQEVQTAPQPTDGTVVDLFSALEQSLAKDGKATGKAKKRSKGRGGKKVSRKRETG